MKSVMLFAMMAATMSLGCRHSHVAGTPSTEAVMDALGASGFDVTAMKDADSDTWTADHCVFGPVAELEVLVCEYQSPDSLAQGEKQVAHEWDVVNVDTAVILHNGRTMLAVADRARKDVGGRAIARMLNAFRALPP